MQPTASKSTSIVALMAVFGLGICFVIVGAISVEYQAALNISNIGNLTLALFLTSAIVQLVVGPLVDKFGYKPLAIIGFLITGSSMILLEVAPNEQMALVACMLLGVGAMSLNTVGNTLIPAVLFEGKDPARASNFGNAFFGLGLVVTPLLFSLVNWKLGLFILAGLFFVGLLGALATKFPQVATGYEFSMAFRVLGKGAVIVGALALFCYISLEVSMTTWSKPYMTELLGGKDNPAAVANAGYVLSLFGVAMMAGRFATSMVKNLTAIGVKLIALDGARGGLRDRRDDHDLVGCYRDGGGRAHRPGVRADLPDHHRRHVREVRAETLRKHLRHHVLGRPAGRDVRPEDRRQPERGRNGSAEPVHRARNGGGAVRDLARSLGWVRAGGRGEASRQSLSLQEAGHAIGTIEVPDSSARGSTRSSTWRR